MPKLEDIKRPVAVELNRYEEFLLESLQSENQMVGGMLTHIFTNRGKAIRPLLALLSASLHSGGKPLPERSYMAAMLLEMVHAASLVHDDVIDRSDMRRGRPSVNALWSRHSAVLIGDYILARSFSMGMDSKQYEIVSYITRRMIDLCEGELMQSRQSEILEMTREVYFDIIYKKTATLIGTSCGVGAMSVGAPEKDIELMKTIGDCLGMAFQIKDDILDFAPSGTGKPHCGDIRERKITLPLLAVMEKSADREHIMGLLSGVEGNPANVDILCDMVTQQGGLDEASRVMHDYVDRAVELLSPIPESPYKQSIAELAAYIAERTY